MLKALGLFGKKVLDVEKEDINEIITENKKEEKKNG